MYNGIGLSTVRGSGTSGYVQANAFNRHKKGHNRPARDGEDDTRHGNRNQGPNEDVLAHNRKRQMELKVFEYRVELEDEGLAEDEIDRLVDVFRAKLVQQEEERGRNLTNVSKGGGTHEAAARKEHDMQKLQDAFGVGSYEEGAAFTKEYHERKKQEREEERSERQRAREDEENRRREHREARELARGQVGDVDLDEEKREKERALDAELDAYREEERDLNVSNTQASGSGLVSDANEQGSGSKGEVEEVPRKRARHDTDSEKEDGDDGNDGDDGDDGNDGNDGPEMKGVGEGEHEEQEILEEHEEQGEEVHDHREEDDAEEKLAPSPAELAPAPQQKSGNELEDLILSLFAEKDVLRKKEIVVAAEEARVEFRDGEYSKLMRKLATSQPGGKWMRNE